MTASPPEISVILLMSRAIVADNMLCGEGRVELNLRWTEGNDSQISHQNWIAGGAYGEVHKVYKILQVCCLT